MYRPVLPNNSYTLESPRKLLSKAAPLINWIQKFEGWIQAHAFLKASVFFQKKMRSTGLDRLGTEWDKTDLTWDMNQA